MKTGQGNGSMFIFYDNLALLTDVSFYHLSLRAVTLSH